MNKAINLELRRSFARATEDIKKSLPSASLLSPEQCRSIIQRYTAAIEGNFVGWMGAAAISARSIEGRFAASENLYVEMKDDHAGMLRDFALSAQAVPSIEHFADVAEQVSSIRKLVAQMSGLKTLTLMAVLENTSGAFIPWLAELAEKCGSSNLKYTDVHGVADMEHAEQFLWAVQCEAVHYTNSKLQIDDVISKTSLFLTRILS